VNRNPLRFALPFYLLIDSKFLYCYLASKWIEAFSGHSGFRGLLNMHTAVLPHARGANAIQQVAALNDAALLRQAAGATIHYIDAGIDTGALIRAERIAEPFAYGDLWQLVAAIYHLGDSLYVRTAAEILDHPESVPAGIRVAGTAQGPSYLRREFTPERRARAEASFLALRQAWLAAREAEEYG
jgi:phosphoribosylglycinamide formyltransferase-1